MKLKIGYLLFLFSALLLFSNGGKEDILSYSVLPKDKLPWPHQKPGMTQSEYQAFLASLIISDNFGSYHGTENMETLYMNDGLGVILNPGTKLYAIISGYIKRSPEQDCLTLGDRPGDSPGYGWEYRNTSNFRFQTGDYVKRGEYLCDVNSQGMLHLCRIRVKEGEWETLADRETFLPDGYFVYQDTLPPEIVSPFIYYANNSEETFEEGSPIELSGDVDIVVAMRDLSESASSGFGLYPLCVAKIEYEIIGEKISTDFQSSFDFNEMINIRVSGLDYDQRVLSVYKNPSSTVLWERGSGSDYFYYIITNINGRKACNKIFDAYQNCAWNTAALDREGKPLFPDGLYTITVKAYDSSGNFSTATDVVRVKNRKKTTIRR